MAAVIALRFRLDRRRGYVINRVHLFNIQLTSYKLADVKQFIERVRFVMSSLQPEELPDKGWMFDWLFEKFREYTQLKSTIEKLKKARLSSHRRTWEYLWSASNTHIIQIHVDENYNNMASRF